MTQSVSVISRDYIRGDSIHPCTVNDTPTSIKQIQYDIFIILNWFAGIEYLSITKPICVLQHLEQQNKCLNDGSKRYSHNDTHCC